MANDINIHVGVDGADESRRRLDGVARSAKGVGDNTAEAGKRGAENTDKLTASAQKSTSAFGRLKDSITGWVGKVFAIGAAVKVVTTAINLQAKAIEELGTACAHWLAAGDMPR